MAAELLCPQWIAPVEPAATVLEDHAVLIEGGSICAIGPAQALRAAHPQASRTELPGHLLIPGLVNAHTHAAMSLLRGVGDDLVLERWLHDRIWPLEGRLLGPEFVFDGALIACYEMLTGGTTCFNDMYFFPEQVLQAAQAVGMRACVGIIAVEFASPYGTGAADYLRKGLALRDRWRDDPMVSFTISPHATYTVSDDTFRTVASLSAELGLPVHCHVHETASEVSDALREHGRRPIERLAELGLLTPDLIAVHAVHLSESDLRLMSQGGVSVAHCPHSNLKLGSGIAPTARMRELGINVAIGTDGSASNNRLDLIQEARTASLLAKGTSGDASAWDAHATLHSSTLGGARALGLAARIGSIVVGKCADLVAVDLSAVELRPVFDPVSQLAYAAGREHVNEVWVAGRHVVSKRQLTDAALRRLVPEVSSRSTLWQNRIGQILSAGP